MFTPFTFHQGSGTGSYWQHKFLKGIIGYHQSPIPNLLVLKKLLIMRSWQENFRSSVTPGGTVEIGVVQTILLTFQKK